MSVFDDLTPQLENLKKCCDHIYAKDLPHAAAAVTEYTCFNIEWFPEPMPVENQAGDAFEREVRSLIADATYLDEAQPMPEEPKPAEDILVFADQGGYCQRVLDRVPEGRINSRRMITKYVGDITREEIDTLVMSQTWDMVIVGCTVDQPKSSAVPDILTMQKDTDNFVFELLRTMNLKEGYVKRLAVITNDIFSSESDTAAERGLGMITHSTMFGMLNTARQEVVMPMHLIDVEDVQCWELEKHTASELFRHATFGVNTVRLCYPSAIRDGRRTNRPVGRHIMRQMPAHNYQTANVKFELPEEGIVAISGGNGSLGLVMGQWLLNLADKYAAESGGTYKPRFSIQFLSRSTRVSEVNQGMWEKLQDHAKRLGIQVAQSRMDMSTQEAVDSWVQGVTPNLIGFIHSAGVLQDSMIPNQTWEKFETVYASKHWAALYLHDALERFANPNLKFFWMFSSVSVYGSMGQLNYSCSNAYMDALARHRIALGKPACAQQWGAWGEVGMASQLDPTMRRRIMMGPQPYFTVKQGLFGLEEGLKTGLPGFSVFLMNPEVYFTMCSYDGGPTARYSRNFTSETITTPAPPNWESHQAYNIYRMLRYIAQPYSDSTPLDWARFVKPRLPQEKSDDDDDNVIELGYGLA